MLELSLDDGAASLAAMPERVRAALAEKVGVLAAALEARIQQKLAGGVLNPRTGALARAMIATFEESPTGVSVRLGVSGDRKYAAIHEFGGTIPPRQIVPDKAKALAFLVAGKQAFARRVNLPAITVPERSYMRSSLTEMVDAIRDELSDAVVKAMS